MKTNFNKYEDRIHTTFDWLAIIALAYWAIEATYYWQAIKRPVPIQYVYKSFAVIFYGMFSFYCYKRANDKRVDKLETQIEFIYRNTKWNP